MLTFLAGYLTTRHDRYGPFAAYAALSIIIQVQGAFNGCPVSVRRAINHWALWRSSDMYLMNTLGRRLGIKKLAGVFTDLDMGPHDGARPERRRRSLARSIARARCSHGFAVNLY